MNESINQSINQSINKKQNVYRSEKSTSVGLTALSQKNQWAGRVQLALWHCVVLSVIILEMLCVWWVGPCDGFTCSFQGEYCTVDKSGEPSCRCNEAIPLLLARVCASNGRTYSNRYEMDNDACKHKVPLHVVHYGACGKKPSTGVVWGGVSPFQWTTGSGGTYVVNSLIRIHARVSAGNVFWKPHYL